MSNKTSTCRPKGSSRHLRLHEAARRYKCAAGTIKVKGEPHPGAPQQWDVMPFLASMLGHPYRHVQHKQAVNFNSGCIAQQMLSVLAYLP